MNGFTKKDHFIKLAVLLLCVLLSFSWLVACVDDPESGGDNGKNEQAGEENGSEDGGNENENGSSDGGENKNEDGENKNDGSSNEGDGAEEWSPGGSGLPSIEFPPIPFD